MTAKKGRMGGMGLGAFSSVKSKAPAKAKAADSEAPAAVPKTKAKKKAKVKAAEELVPINVKLPKSQRDWLREHAETVRGNNDSPVAAKDRVFPQHLLQVAGELLKAADVDWDMVKTTEDLRQQLGLSD